MRSRRLFRADLFVVEIQSHRKEAPDQVDAQSLAAHRVSYATIARPNLLVDEQAIDRTLALDLAKYLDCPTFLAIEVSRFQWLPVLLHRDRKMSRWSDSGVTTYALLTDLDVVDLF